MIKLKLISGEMVETDLTINNLNTLIKTNALILTTTGEYVNPKNVEKVFGPAPQPLISNFPVNNFRVPTEEEQKEAQYKMQPLKKLFDERAAFDKSLRDKELHQWNSQSIYGAKKPEQTPEVVAVAPEIKAEIPQTAVLPVEAPKKKRGRPKKEAK